MSEQQHWTTLSSELKYKNPWISVVEDKVKTSWGTEKTYGVVSIVSGVSVLPMDAEGFVYLVKLYRYGVKKMGIETAGGTVDEGEDPFTAAKRELKEELGIEPKEWIPLGHLNPLTGVISHRENLFLARGFIPPKEIPVDDDEHMEMIRIPFHEALDLVMNSEITHGPSAVLILKAAQLGVQLG